MRTSLRSRVKNLFVPLVLRVVELIGAILIPVHGKLKFYNELHIKFRTRSTDIFVVTYPKSGTTWMLSVLHQLMSDGRMNFTHIRDLYPFIEYNFDNGVDFRLEGVKRRVYASHLGYFRVPKGDCKYIFVMRNPFDVLVSSYYHDKNSHKYAGTFDDYLDQYVNSPDNGKWAYYTSQWLANKQNLDVLYIRYEDMISNLQKCIAEVSAFCNLPVDETEWPRILEGASLAHMKKHEDKFDMNRYMINLFGWSITDQFIRGGPRKDKHTFSQAQSDKLFAEFNKFVPGVDLKKYYPDLAPFN